MEDKEMGGQREAAGSDMREVKGREKDKVEWQKKEQDGVFSIAREGSASLHRVVGHAVLAARSAGLSILGPHVGEHGADET
jgi:hypothetical protein